MGIGVIIGRDASKVAAVKIWIIKMEGLYIGTVVNSVGMSR